MRPLLIITGCYLGLLALGTIVEVVVYSDWVTFALLFGGWSFTTPALGFIFWKIEIDQAI